MDVSGRLSKSGSQVSRELAKAQAVYVLRDTIVAGTIDCRDGTVECAITFENCSIEHFDACRSTLRGAVGFIACTTGAVSLQDAVVDGGVTFRDGTCSVLTADRARFAGHLTVDCTILTNLSCGGLEIRSELVIRTHVLHECTFEGARGSGKLDLTGTTAHGDMSLRHSQFDVVFLDHVSVAGALEAARIVVNKSLYARYVEVADDLSLKGARIDGQVLLHDAWIMGELNLSGLRANSLHMNRGRIDGGVRGRGVAVKDALLFKWSKIGYKLVLKGAVLGEISLFGSDLQDVDMFDVTVRGSAIFGLPPTIENAGYIAPNARRPPPSSDPEIAQLQARRALYARKLHCDGMRCESLLLHRAHIDQICLQNATVQSLADFTEVACSGLTIEMSRIGGNLRATQTTVGGSMTILSTKVDSVSTFRGAQIGRLESMDSIFHSLVLATHVDGEGARRSSVRSIELNDVRAEIVTLDDVIGLQDLEIKAAVVTRLDLKTLQRLPHRLAITTSQIGEIVLDSTPSYAPLSERKHPCHPRYEGCEIVLAGTKYSTMTCDVGSLLRLWLPAKTGNPSRPELSIRPSLSILEGALRSSGYDDWADGVYQVFRRQARSDPQEHHWHKRRNWIADTLIGYGFSTRNALIMVLLPLIIGFGLTTIPQHMTTFRPAAPIAGASPKPAAPGVAAPPHPPLSSAAELVLRSYLPIGGEPTTLEYRRCVASQNYCPEILGAVLRACGFLAIPLFLANLTGLLRYTDRRGG